MTPSSTHDSAPDNRLSRTSLRGRLPVVTLGATGAAIALAALVAARTFALHPCRDAPTWLELTVLVAQLAALYWLPFLAVGWGGALLLRALGKRHREGALTALLLLFPLAWWLGSALHGDAEPYASQRAGATEPNSPPEASREMAMPEPADPDPPPVVLLVIDGLDPGLLHELVGRGELPTFGRLVAEGTSGPLATLEPTVSPLLWTSLATGRSPRDHGVLHFVRHRVPGLRQPIDRFPPRAGLNHHLVPWLERRSWSGWRAVPYTSSARRCRALWDIVDEHWPVGVYRWLVTWPAEPVAGFLVAGELWASPHRGFEPRTGEATEQGWSWPEELAGTLAPLRDPVRRRELRPYLAAGATPEPRRTEERFIARSLRDPTLRDLTRLTRRHRPKLLAAAFYSVDAFAHHFSDQHRDGGRYAPALTERYRFTDRMLGRLLERLDAVYRRPYHLLVVSDHGWDFAAGHHFTAPDGVLIAHGPAFAPGRRASGATLLDVAPLVLRLLGLPLAEDMPGTASHGLVLEPGLELPERRIASWELGERGAAAAVEALDERRRRELRALGYLP